MFKHNDPIKDNIRVVHAPGAMNDIAERAGFYQDLTQKITLSDQLSVMSIMNKDCLDKSYLYKQCVNNNIKIIIPELTYNIPKNTWKNTYKIDGILEALESINTPYVLILDGRDTKLVGNLDDDFINLFLSFEKDIIYNGNDGVWPGEKLENEIGAEITDTNYFVTQYINAGVCIGLRTKLIEFYKECKQYIADNNVNEERSPSEQLVVRKVAAKTSIKVGTDAYLKMFASYLKYRRM